MDMPLQKPTPPVSPYRGLYEPQNPRPFKVSRSKIELYVNCQRCFYLDRKLGIARTSFPAFLLNSAVDTLFKKEFDIHRAKGEPHPLMKAYKIDALPYVHKDLDRWRENFVGIEHHHQPTNLWIHGAVDDVWQSPNGELIVVDYKATAKDAGPSIEGKWQQSYKRQLEVYQWILRQMGHNVSSLGYFVYANGKTDRKAFDQKLEFDVIVIPYKGDDSWVEPTIKDLHALLNQDEVPHPNLECEYCSYYRQRAKLKV